MVNEKGSGRLMVVHGGYSWREQCSIDLRELISQKMRGQEQYTGWTCIVGFKDKGGNIDLIADGDKKGNMNQKDRLSLIKLFKQHMREID